MTRQIWSIEGNAQRLDGGAMFGNAPKAVWARWMPPDEQNRIALACRALLVKDGGRHILFEAGIGAFFPPKLRARFGVTERHNVLLSSLRAAGVDHTQIDVVVLSHLHFDHVGGLLAAWTGEGVPHELLFPKAQFVVGRAAWERACKPHKRDRASFIPELQPLLQASGRLEIVDSSTSKNLGDAYQLHYSHGHTPGLMLAEIPSKEGPIVFAGDLIPGVPWVHLPITMGYDRYPELLIDEKSALLRDLLSRNGRLFFTHDHCTAMGRLSIDERGRYGVGERWETLSGFSI